MGWGDLRHFTQAEFNCSHTGENHMNLSFVEILDEFRDDLQFPFIITSGYRDPTHPVEARKAAPGVHTSGVAADIALHGNQAMALVSRALQHPAISGVGVKQHGDVDTRFIHLDAGAAMPNRPRPWLWSYA